MIFSVLLGLLKNNWKLIVVGLFIIGLVAAGWYAKTRYDNLIEENEELRQKNRIQEEIIKEKDFQIELSERFIDALNEYEEKEKISEHHYHKKVINNEKVVKEYIEKQENPEEKKKYYDYINNKWDSLNQLNGVKNEKERFIKKN